MVFYVRIANVASGLLLDVYLRSSAKLGRRFNPATPTLIGAASPLVYLFLWDKVEHSLTLP